MSRSRRRLLALLVAVVGLLLISASAHAQESPAASLPADRVVLAQDGGELPQQQDDVAVPDVPDVPDVSISVESDQGGLSQTVVIMLLVTVGSVAPAILLLMTSFTRFIIVLSLTRQAIGLQTVPPAQVLVGLAMFLSLFTMSDVFSAVNAEAVQPMLNGEITQAEAISAGYEPLRDFMLAQTREDDLQLMVDLSGQAEPATPEDISAATLVPAYVISEMRAAFMMGFVIFIPFLIIDLVVAAVLMSMGMMMLPPVFISLPLKLLLFVLVDGWVLITGSVVQSVQGVT